MFVKQGLQTFDGITAKSCVRNRRLFPLLPFLIFVASQLPKFSNGLLHLGKSWGLTPERSRHGTALPEYLWSASRSNLRKTR